MGNLSDKLIVYPPRDPPAARAHIMATHVKALIRLISTRDGCSARQWFYTKLLSILELCEFYSSNDIVFIDSDDK